MAERACSACGNTEGSFRELSAGGGIYLCMLCAKLPREVVLNVVYMRQMGKALALIGDYLTDLRRAVEGVSKELRLMFERAPYVVG